VLKLYRRENCGLCEHAIEVLLALEPEVPWLEIDIDSKAELTAAFGTRIPVLEDERGRQLNWPFDAYDVRMWLTAEQP
jgi:hypothetical protein